MTCNTSKLFQEKRLIVLSKVVSEKQHLLNLQFGPNKSVVVIFCYSFRRRW